VWSYLGFKDKHSACALPSMQKPLLAKQAKGGKVKINDFLELVEILQRIKRKPYFIRLLYNILQSELMDEKKRRGKTRREIKEFYGRDAGK
jgi:hypothetical protein